MAKNKYFTWEKLTKDKNALNTLQKAMTKEHANYGALSDYVDVDDIEAILKGQKTVADVFHDKGYIQEKWYGQYDYSTMTYLERQAYDNLYKLVNLSEEEGTVLSWKYDDRFTNKTGKAEFAAEDKAIKEWEKLGVKVEFDENYDVVTDVPLTEKGFVQNPNYRTANAAHEALSEAVYDETTGITYPSMSAAADALGVSKANISKQLKGERKSVAGHVFRKVDDTTSKTTNYLELPERQVSGYSVSEHPERAQNKVKIESTYAGEFENWLNKMDYDRRQEYYKTHGAPDEGKIGAKTENSELGYTYKAERPMREYLTEPERNVVGIAVYNPDSRTYSQDYWEKREENNQAYVDKTIGAADTLVQAALKEAYESSVASINEFYSKLEEGYVPSKSELLRNEQYLVMNEAIQQHYEKAGEAQIYAVEHALTDVAEHVLNGYSEEQVLAFATTEFNGINYSERIWDNTELLAEKAQVAVGEAIILGKSVNEAARDLAGVTTQGKNAAERLIRTETARVYVKAEEQNYKESGVEYVEVLVEPDACEACEALKGKKFHLGEQPTLPVHPNCRCDLLPVV